MQAANKLRGATKKEAISNQLNNLNQLILQIEVLSRQFENARQQINNSPELTSSQRQQAISRLETPLQQLLENCQRKQGELKSLLDSQEESKLATYLPWVLGGTGIVSVIALFGYFLGRRKGKRKTYG